jgi:hypothetical protein
MGYTPRQISVRAQESAWKLLAALDREGVVATFLDSYAARFNRPGYNDQPAHYREMLETIRREALLEMVCFLEGELPRLLGILTKSKTATSRGKKANSKKTKKPQIVKSPRMNAADRQKTDLFRQEFFSAFGKVMEWKKEEFGEFWRDYELYRKLGAKAEESAAKRKSDAMVAGPFVDRCALLLDPSLMETARSEAARFRAELHQKTTAILKQVFADREN